MNTSMNKHVKSTLVKILAALALAFACVAVANAFSTNTSTTQTVQAARKLSKAEKAAKRWIAMCESGGSYTASTQGELVKAIGTNNAAPTTKPIRNTRNGPTSSILCPIRDAAISVPRPGVAATTPATKATSPP